MRTFLFIILTTLSLNFLHAEEAIKPWDAKAFAGLRSYPLSGAIGLETGYSSYLWGLKSEDPLGWGYLRIGALVQSSGKVNKAELKLSFYPIPVVGLWLDFGASTRNLKTIQTLNCASINCKGSIQRTRIGSEFKGSIEKVFGKIQSTYSWLEPGDSARSYADEASNLQMERGGDRLFSWSFVMGAPYEADFQVALFLEKNQMQYSEFSNLSRGILALHHWDDHTIQWGAGLYSSQTSRLHGQIFVGYSYQFSKGLGI